MVTSRREQSALTALGLTGYEAAAYAALTRRGRATGAELARLAGLPRQRIYDVLDGLVARGFATVEPGRPARYTAIAPQQALDTLLDEHRASFEVLQQRAVEAVALLTPAFREGRDANDPLGFIEILHGGAIGPRFEELQASAQREVLVFTKPPYAVEPAENAEGLALLRRGVVARSVYERSVYEDEAVVAAVRTFVAAGEQARVVDRLPLKLVLIDGRVALFAMDPVAGATELTVMVVEHPAFAALLELAFEHAWSAGEPFGAT